MKLLRRLQAFPEIFVFYCERCKEATTKVLEKAECSPLPASRQAVAGIKALSAPSCSCKPSTTVVHQPTAAELKQEKEGDYYAPAKGE
jgi:hypothetical protein